MSLDSFFDETKPGLIKDLVDFDSRKDFDNYMRGLESQYYEHSGLLKLPYENVPTYPPQPF